jgi:DNA-binding NarL/FixJ family response regulator
MVFETVSVVVADDHELFRRGLVQLLEDRRIKVLGVASSGSEAVTLAAELMPAVVLMDLNMPGMSGIEATQRLASTAPLVRVLVLTVVDDARNVTDALLAGACGYLLKDATIDQIVDGVRAAANGESLISPRIASRLVRYVREPSDPERGLAGADLTNRELQILDLIARGADNPTIANTLFLSQHTVKNHVSSILVKLQVQNRIQAAVRAVRQGLV